MEVCTGCKTTMWPSRPSVVQLPVQTAPLWTRYANLFRPAQAGIFRLAGDSARAGRPIAWSTLTDLYTSIEGPLLTGDGDLRWLSVLHWEARRAHRTLQGPIARCIPAIPVEEEPCIPLTYLPQATTRKVLAHSFVVIPR